MKIYQKASQGRDAAHGVLVGRSSINCWAIRFLPLLENVFRKHKHAVGNSWRTDETYSKIKGAWKYLYWAVGKEVDFLLNAKQDASAARRFFGKAMRHNDVPARVTMGKSGVNKAALDQLNTEREIPIAIRQIKYFKNVVAQDQRAVKRVTRPMLGFRSFGLAQVILAGIELMPMIRKGQFIMAG